MSQADQKIAEATLRQQIDDLALELVMSDGASAGQVQTMCQTLERVSQGAIEAGWEQVAEVVEDLRGELEVDGATGIREASLLRLQQAVENASRQEQGKATAPAAAPSNSIANDPELLSDFILESREHLTSIESGLLALDLDPLNTDPIHSVFRGFHTIKGLAGFLELPAIRAVAHEVETVLDLARSAQLTIDAGVIDVVLEGADYLKNEILQVEALLNGGRALPPADSEPLLARIRRLQDPGAASDTPEEEVEDEIPVLVAATAGSGQPTKPEANRPKNAEARSVKVDTGKLDFLVDMVGEMVIAQSMLRHDEIRNNNSNPQAQRNLSQLARITGEVQKTAMSMRMVPVGQLFARMARLVRDLTRNSGKQAELVLQGEDTELDRTIVEDLADPLMHMVRNAADHGIETPGERAAKGKNPSAKIGLKAYHQAGHIIVEVSDDGRGLDREKILNKARLKGLVEGGAELSDQQVFAMIFEPGFSTAEKVTDISGRGVGMDVVKKQIQKMRGRVDIQSVQGEGTTFFLRLPLTLAMIDGLVLGVGRERYIAPIFAVRETFRPTPDMISTLQGKSEMVMVRGKLLPLIRLHQRFGVQPGTTDPCKAVVVVIESGTRNYCLLVDELIGKQEVVIKTLGESFRQVTGVAGGAILGDGRVGLILEMDGLFDESARV